MKEYYYISEVADILGISKETLKRWDKSGKLNPIRHPINNYRVYHIDQLKVFEQVQLLLNSSWIIDEQVTPSRDYYSIELFAGAGGLAIGMEQAGFKHLLLNEVDKHCANTLSLNRPSWPIVCDDIKNLCFKKYFNKVDIVTGGFPCQAFSYAGKKLGFEDARGTLFYEFARCVKETNPKILLAENVRGLLTHDNGKTLDAIRSVIDELGYHLIEPKILKAIFYKVQGSAEARKANFSCYS
ncbi:DNA (cytosine-5-)-methyltransferase [Cysteiniphilum sp. 19S12-1]|uniref:DNA (cytosine-5-)-methyltransferase n=1 Tax=Cysteiniphilum sp. 19S12-1 TaxID=3453130 RepID=UPI003F835558